jgi:hypothetical protein
MKLQGACHAMFAYDVGSSVDLKAAEALLEEARRVSLQRKRRAPPEAGALSPALRFTQPAEAIEIGAWRSSETVETTVYEFGAVCVTYGIPLEAELGDLVALSELLYDNAALLADSRARVDQLLAVLGSAVGKPAVAEVAEDYAVFELRPPAPPAALQDLWTQHGSTVARILRGERSELSEQEVADALSQRISYGPDDAVLIDWYAALLVGEGMDDERAVLELATVELLELRYLDARLDRGLDDAHDVLTRARPRRWGMPRGWAHDLQRVGRLQADNAMLFEGVSNALKLLGDQYLARLYRMVSARFHLAEWDGSIARKLQTLRSIYGQLADLAGTGRAEALEWIIIVLIAVSIAIYFVPGLPVAR